MRIQKDHFIAGMRYPLAKDAQMTPPVPCEFAVGDLVTFTNDFGAVFPNKVVTGFSPTVEHGRFVYFDADAWWFPVSPSNLSRQAPAELHSTEEWMPIATAPRDGTELLVVPEGDYDRALFQDGYWFWSTPGAESIAAGPEPRGWKPLLLNAGVDHE